MEEKYKQFLGIFFGIVNGSTRFLWGILMDKFPFKLLMSIVLLLEIGVAFSINFTGSIPIIYLILNFIVALCLSGTFTMITPQFNKVFGFKNGASIFGLTGMLIGLSSFTGPMIARLLASDKKDEELKKAYMILYFISGAMPVVNLIALMFFKDEKFKYQKLIVNENLIPENIEEELETDE